jgi:hypothetical protein
MTAPLTTLRAKLTPSEPHRYLMDDIFEWALSKRGRENIALSALALGSIAGIYLVGRYG